MNRLVQRSTVIAAKGWPVAVRNADSGDFDEAYDQAGRLLRSTNGAGETLKYTWDLRGNLIQTTQPMGQATRAAYDARNRKILEIDANGALATWSYTYFGQLAAHRVIRSAPAGLGVDYITLQRQQSAATGNAALQARQSLYDANGRMVHQKTTEYLVAENAVNYDYDAEGNVLGYLVADTVNNTFTRTANTVVRAEGYRTAASVSETKNAITGALMTRGGLGYHYDANGHLSGTGDAGQMTHPTLRTHNFVNDANGNALYAYYAYEGTPQVHANGQRQLVVNGEVLGRYGLLADTRFEGTPLAQNGPLFSAQSDFSFGYQPIDGNYPAGSPGTYAVATGDTLQSIARGAYGDASLWYLIADANGLSSDADLRTGQVLRIPTRVGSADNASTFRPYDPSKIASDSATMMATPQAEDDGCGVVGQIIMVVIAVVVTIYTGGVAGAMLGSVLSQAAGVAMGNLEEISWKQVALAGLSAGIGAGVSEVIGPSIQSITESALATRIVTVAISNAVTQGIAVATGLQDRFDWRGVAGSAIGAGVGMGLNLAMDYNPSVGGFDVGKSLVSGLGGSIVGQVVRGGKVSAATLAADAFGNALGDSLARANGQQADPLGEFIAKNQQSWDTRAAAYDQIVGAFSQPGGNRSAGVQLAAGPGYSGMGTGSGREQNIDRMLDLANRPESGGTWSSMGADGVPRVGFGVFGQAESIRSDDGRGFIDEVRSATEGSINQGGAMGTPLPPSPYRWVSNELVDGDLVRGHWADAPQNVRPGDSIRALSDSEAFFAFNPLGRTLSGVGTGLENMAMGMVNLGKQAVLTASDAIGTGVYGLNNALGGRPMSYPLDSALGRSLQTQGFGPTALNTAGGLMRGLASPVTAPFGALYRQDPRAFGESLPGTVLAAAPLLRGGAVVADAAGTSSNVGRVAGVVDGAGETVTVFRVQGGTPPLASRQLITIDENGNPLINRTTLTISIGDPAHAEYFLSKRPGANVTSFEIPKWMGDFIGEEAIPQAGYRTNPANQGGLAPKVVDPTTPGRSYELPDIWGQWLQEVAIPGSGRVTKGGG